MRLPGTHNTKFDSWVSVEVEISTGAQYHLEELEEWLATDTHPLLERRPVSGGSTPATPGALPVHDNPFLAAAATMGFKPPIDVDATLAGMFVGPRGHNGNIHISSLSVSAALLQRGVDPEEVTKIVVDAVMATAAKAGMTWSRDVEEHEWVRPMVAKWLEKHPQVRSGEPSPAPKVSGGEPVREPDNDHNRGQPDRASGVIDFGAEQAKRKAKPGPKEKSTEAPFVVAAGVITALRSVKEDIMLAEGEIWLYRDGFWRTMAPVDEQRILVLIQEGFETLGFQAKAQHLNLAWMRLRQHPVLIRYDVPWADAGLIVCRNGVLRLDAGKFDRHHPANYARRHIGATYTPGASCPIFERLIASMFGNQPDAPATIGLVQEWVGAALAIASMTREERRAMILVGPSRTGKTELARIFALLLGDPIAAPAVSEIGERFGLSSLYGAAAWVRDDAINEGDKLDPQRFKTIVTGEAVNVELKGRHVIPNVRLNTPVLLTCNSLPRARDGSDAIFNRSIVVTMTNVIDEKAAKTARGEILGQASDVSLGAAVFELEAPGILNWALAGLERLRARGFYEIPEGVAMALQRFKDENNPVGEWAREAIEVSAGTRIERQDLVRSYNGWEHDMEGDEAISRGGRWLLPKLRARFPGLGEMTNHAGRRYIIGIKLTVMGLASWESYAKASQKPGGFATVKNDVNQVHSEEPEIDRSRTKF